MKITLTFFCLCLSILISSAKELYFRHIDPDAGTNQSSAISIYQDPYNRIWFGNNYLNVYDGGKIQTFSPGSRLENIMDNNIHMICGDGMNCLYMLANINLIKYAYKYDTFYDTGLLATALFYSEDILYYGYGNKLFGLNEAGESCSICQFGDKSTKIQCISSSKEGLLIGTNKGLYVYKKGELNSVYKNISVSAIFQDSYQDLWVGTHSEGVFVNKGERWEHIHENSALYNLTNNQIRCIHEDDSGNIWIGTFSGITIYYPDTQKTTHIHPDQTTGWTLRHSSVYDIKKDHQGGMWIGTYYGGLSYFNPDTERYYFYPADHKNPDKLNGFLFGSMTEDEKGTIYIATESGGLNRINKYTKDIDNFSDIRFNIPFNTAKSVWYDKEKELLYIGTFLKGLYTYSPEKRVFTPIGKDIFNTPSLSIITHLIEWEGVLLLVTQGGLYKMDLQTQEIVPFFTDEELQTETSHVIWDTYLDKKKNRLWLAKAHQEIMYIDLKTEEIYFVPCISAYVGSNSIKSIDGDGNGKLYVLATHKGIIEYDESTQEIRNVDFPSGYAIDEQVLKVLVIRPDVLLLTSFKSIGLLNLATGIYYTTLLGDASPLHNLNPNGGIYLSPENKEIFIGGIEGVLSVTEEGLLTPETDYSLGFGSLYINNEASTVHEFLVLPYNKNNISIEFFCTDFRHLTFNRFEYKLEGLDKQWVPTLHKSITYSSLPPGKYQLHVRETTSGKEITMGIRIIPPFYLSLYAWVLYGIIVVCILWWIIYFSRRQAVLKASLNLEKREKKQMEELNQMKLRFYINISHELRTPLTLISNQLELILKKNGLPAPSLRKFTKIKHYTEQLNNLISEILDLRKLEQGKMPLRAQYVELVSFTQKIFDSFIDYATYHGVVYKLEYADEELYVWIDPAQMQKVFNNLLSNAFKFTEAGGIITIRLEKDGEYIYIYVRDSGCGIPEKYQQQIFERFYQVDTLSDQQQVGTGIGLALTKEIINQHDGTISVESEPGKGTCFIVALKRGDTHLTAEQKVPEMPVITNFSSPFFTSSSEEEDTEEVDDFIPEKDKKRILLIEDNEELLNLLTEAFSPMYTIHTARNGEDGVKLAETLLPDLIISDVMMPGKNGVEMCKELKRKIVTSPIPIILLSARTDQEKVIEALQYGATDYITKPFNLETLLLKCKNLLQYGSHLSQQYSQEVSTSGLALATSRKDQVLLEKSIQLIEDNMENKDFSIDLWCREMAIGRTRLGAKIKTLTGMTLNDFILHIKLKKCAEFLKDNDLTISEIAWQCGFSSPGYMGKCFKNQFGMTPLEYRNKNKRAG